MPLQNKESDGCFLLSGTFLLSCCSIAFFKLTSWFFSSGAFFISNEEFGINEVFVQLVMMVLLLLADHFYEYTSRQAAVALLAAASCQAVGSFLLFSPAFGNEHALLSALILRGSGSAVFLLGFARLLCSLEPVKSALVIVGGQMIAALLPVFLVSIPAEAVPFASSMLPLAAAFCMLWAIEKSVPSERSSIIIQDRLRGIPIHPIILLGLCALSTIGIALLGQASPSSIDPLHRLFIISINLAVFLVYVIWIYGLKRNDPDTIWPFLMLIFFISLFAFSSFSSFAFDTMFSLVSATQKMLMVFAWVFMASIIYQHKLPAIPCFCIGQMVISQIPHSIAFFIKKIDLVSRLAESHQEAFATILAAIMAFAIISGVLVVVYKSKPSAPDEANPALRENALGEAVDSLSCRYSLSNREAEIALLLAQGLTLREAGEKLVISIDTVRTHAKNLYRKLDIHKRQELLEMIRAEASEDLTLSE